MPNVHLKYQILDRDPVWLAVLGAVYYARLDGGQDVNGHLIDVPLSLFATVKVHPRIYLHGEGTYIFARAGRQRRSHQGAVQRRRRRCARARPGLMAQFRVSRIVSLTATGRYQFYVADIPFDGHLDARSLHDRHGEGAAGARRSNTRGRSSAAWRCCGSTST